MRWPFYRKSRYVLVTGHAGFFVLTKDGKRIQPHNWRLEFKA